MNRTDRDAMLDALRAQEPDARLADKLNLFGQFIGSWALEVTNYLPGRRQRDGTRGSGASAGSCRGGPCKTSI